MSFDYRKIIIIITVFFFHFKDCFKFGPIFGFKSLIRESETKEKKKIRVLYFPLLLETFRSLVVVDDDDQKKKKKLSLSDQSNSGKRNRESVFSFDCLSVIVDLGFGYWWWWWCRTRTKSPRRETLDPDSERSKIVHPQKVKITILVQKIKIIKQNIKSKVASS